MPVSNYDEAHDVLSRLRRDLTAGTQREDVDEVLAWLPNIFSRAKSIEMVEAVKEAVVASHVDMQALNTRVEGLPDALASLKELADTRTKVEERRFEITKAWLSPKFWAYLVVLVSGSCGGGMVVSETEALDLIGSYDAPETETEAEAVHADPNAP